MITMCDIDGTLITKPDTQPIDFTNTQVDYNMDVVVILEWFSGFSEIVFFTKRRRKYEAQTREIIDRVFKNNYSLIMRDDNDFSESSTATIKIGMYIEHIHDSVFAYLEDDFETCEYFTLMGVPTISPNTLSMYSALLDNMRTLSTVKDPAMLTIMAGLLGLGKK